MSHTSVLRQNTSLNELYDLATLREHAAQIAHVRATASPCLEVSTPTTRPVKDAPLLVLSGSYNPPTNAHLALAEASLQAIPQANLFLILGTTIINKEATERATLLDRVVLLEEIVRRSRDMGVFLTNQGLYVEQAKAIRAAFPRASELIFVVGFDKIEQIFDARYYQDRDAALTKLFSLASFLVAPRADHEAADIAALLNQPGNQQFQTNVRLLPFPGAYREVSSSQIRAAFQAHPYDLSKQLLAAALPPEAQDFIRETGCYMPPVPLSDGEEIDRYGIRSTLIAHALLLPEAAQASLDLRRLFHLATSASPKGRALRHWLREPEAARAPQDLLRFS
jgi:nicotinic acid mononucleotide adenylyltransferase